MAIDPDLRRRVQAGEYVVDPHAVAGAILRRRDDIAQARRLSRVLVAGEIDASAVRGDDPQPRPGQDAS